MTFIPGAKIEEEVEQISDGRQISIIDKLNEISEKLSIIILHLEKVTDEKIRAKDWGR